jgi:hypothetical protein
MSTVLEIMNKFFFILVVSSTIFACSTKTKEFDLQCQSGWKEALPLSNTIYNKLSEYEFLRYISVKSGNDRGAYDFYFLGQTSDSGIFLHADKAKLTLAKVSPKVVSEAFSLLPKDINTIKGYTGSGDIWAHLSCEYMKISTSEQVKTLTFRDIMLLPSDTDPASRQGVETLKNVKSYLNTYFEKQSEDLTTIKVETLPELEKESAKTISERKTKYQLFYEIPI